jgi:DNA invertase Pin-like site-specific DNA recombinase
MMLDMLAAISRKDYEDRRRRQGEGIKKARNAGKYKGRKRNTARLETISALLKDERSYSEIVRLTKCSRATIASVKG